MAGQTALTRRVLAKALAADLSGVALDAMNAATNADVAVSRVLIDPVARSVTVVQLGGQAAAARLISVLCARGSITFQTRAPLDGPRTAWFEGRTQPSPGLSVLVRMMVTGGDDS